MIVRTYRNGSFVTNEYPIAVINQLKEIDSSNCLFDLPNFDDTYPKPTYLSINKGTIQEFDRQLDEINTQQNKFLPQEQALIVFLHIKIQILFLRSTLLTAEEKKGTMIKAVNKFHEINGIFDELKHSHYIFWSNHRVALIKIGKQLLPFFLPKGVGEYIITTIMNRHDPEMTPYQPPKKLKLK
jgi:hypothetical protein